MNEPRPPLGVAQAIYAAFADDDLPGIRRLLADDLQWRQAASAVPAAGIDGRGADAFVERVIQPIRTDWDGFTEQVDELHVAGDVVTATGTYHGTHRATGRRLSAEFCHLWTVHEGLAHRFRQYTDTAAFAHATG